MRELALPGAQVQLRGSFKVDLLHKIVPKAKILSQKRLVDLGVQCRKLEFQELLKLRHKTPPFP